MNNILRGVPILILTWTKIYSCNNYNSSQSGFFSHSSNNLKHKDSFGKSENLSKIFFAEILVFDHDYEGKSSSS